MLNRKKSVKCLNYLFIGVFIVLLFIPMLHISNEEKSSQENRMLAKKPQISKIWESSSVKYGEQFDNWFNDHFWGRRRLIKKHQKLYYALNSKVENDQAFLGNNGWLYTKSFNAVNMYKHDNLFTETELQQIRKNINNFLKSAKKIGVKKVYFYLSNDKESLYPEFYKTDIAQLPQPSRLEQFLSYMHTNYPAIPVLNFQKKLEQIKSKGEVLFCKTGTHMNSIGSFYEYYFLMQRMKQDFPQINPLTSDDFDITRQKSCDMDLYDSLALSPAKYSDLNLINKVLILKKRSKLEESMITDGEYITYKSVRNREALNKLHILVLHDSFFTGYAPYFYETFHWTEDIFFGNGSDFILTNQEKQRFLNHIPDIIMIETTERFLQRFLTLELPIEK